MTDIGLLRRVAERRESEADREALADRLRSYLDGASAGLSLDAAFGLVPGAGCIAWWRVEALAKRDAALRALAARHYDSLTVRAQASAIRATLSAYASGCWRFDRASLSAPITYIGTEREMLFDVMKARAAVPSARQIRRVLSP
ncbi:hypothetical protein ASG52_19835 [Methylobacterium sp. Leaf456]|uniref:hypothetical protein n=1 Tax=Methylobacterium sp. Leaf456 TaxID=1736382 RepID=UPI0006F439C4|nr:hypothetical protein [Methylobacterium sp. Leaf456]KQT59979.1 hypothetical protein ASG52_19835 [Methylobacterium sp. Leaf456]